jgi:serine/threonine protein kinase
MVDMEEYKYKIGQILDENYEILEQLGKGSFSEVYKVQNLTDEQVYVLKIMIPIHEGGTVLSRLQSEAKILKDLINDHIARFISAGRFSNGDLYIILEYVEGATLKKIISESGGVIPPVALETTRRAVLDLLTALKYLHERSNPILHRDINPRNLILNPTRGLVIIDFNVSKIMSEGEIAKTYVGTPPYIPPEVPISGWSPLGDLYAVGIVLFNLITGKPDPFDDPADRMDGKKPPHDPGEFYPDLPPEISAIVLRAISHDSKDRYQSASLMRQEIEEKWPTAVPQNLPTEGQKDFALIYAKLNSLKEGLEKGPNDWKAEEEGIQFLKAQLERLKGLNESETVEVERLLEKLKQLTGVLAEMADKELHKRIAILESADVVNDGTEADAKMVNELMALLLRLSPVQEELGALQVQAKNVFNRIKMLKLALKNEDLVKVTIEKIKADESTGVFGADLVSQSVALRQHVYSDYEYAKSIGGEIWPDIVTRLGNSFKKSEEFYDEIRNVHEEAGTFDKTEKFDKAYKLILRLEGERRQDGKMTYFADVSAINETLVSIRIAKAVCIQRWAVVLNKRIKAHLDSSEAKLAESDCDPRAAQLELEKINESLNQIRAIDDKLLSSLVLDEYLKILIPKLQEKVEQELARLKEFEDSIAECLDKSPFECWEGMQALTTNDKYKKFQKSSLAWTKDQPEARQRLSEEIWNELGLACLDIWQHQVEEVKIKLVYLDEAVKPIQGDFPDEWDSLVSLNKIWGHLLSEAAQIGSLISRKGHIDLPAAGQRLENLKKDLVIATQSLPALLQVQIKKRIPNTNWEKQAEIQRLEKLLNANSRAHVFISKTEEQAKSTENLEELEKLRQDVRDASEIVPAEFREEYGRLAAYVEARYNFYAAELILRTDGDPALALPRYQAALQENEFRETAKKGIEEIEKRRTPANKRTDRILAEIIQLEKQKNWWEAYQKAKVARRDEPSADKDRKRKLLEKEESDGSLAFQSSCTILREAIAVHSGDPKELRRNLDRVLELDPLQDQFLKQESTQAFHIVHRLEAENAVKAQNWKKATAAYSDAAEIIKDLDALAAEEDRNLALAVGKEELLNLDPTLPEDILKDRLKNAQSQTYSGDPDIQIMLARVFLKSSEKLQDDPDKQNVFDQTTALADLNNAKTWLETAETAANRWRTATLPAYETARNNLLNRAPDEQNSLRFEEIEKHTRNLKLDLMKARLSITKRLQNSWNSDVEVPSGDHARYDVAALALSIEEAERMLTNNEFRAPELRRNTRWWDTIKADHLAKLQEKVDSIVGQDLGSRLFYELGIYLLDPTRQAGRVAVGNDLERYKIELTKFMQREQTPGMLSGTVSAEPPWRILSLQIRRLHQLLNDFHQLISALSVIARLTREAQHQTSIAMLVQKRSDLEEIIEDLEKLSVSITGVIRWLPVAYQENAQHQWVLINKHLVTWDDKNLPPPPFPPHLNTHATLNWITDCLSDLKTRRERLEKMKKKIVASLYYELLTVAPEQPAGSSPAEVQTDYHIEEISINHDFWKAAEGWAARQDTLADTQQSHRIPLLTQALNQLAQLKDEAEPSERFQFEIEEGKPEAGKNERGWKPSSFVEGTYRKLAGQIDESLSSCGSRRPWQRNLVSNYISFKARQSNKVEPDAGLSAERDSLNDCSLELDVVKLLVSRLEEFDLFQRLSKPAVQAVRKARFKQPVEDCTCALNQINAVPDAMKPNESDEKTATVAPAKWLQAIQDRLPVTIADAEKEKVLLESHFASLPGDRLISLSERRLIGHLGDIEKKLTLQREKTLDLLKGIRRNETQLENGNDAIDRIFKSHKEHSQKRRLYAWFAPQEVETLSINEVAFFSELVQHFPDETDFDFHCYVDKFKIRVDFLNLEDWIIRYLPEAGR